MGVYERGWKSTTSLGQCWTWRGEEPRRGYEIGMQARVESPKRQIRELNRQANQAEPELTCQRRLLRG